MRAEITAIPDGVYQFEERMEDDGVDPDPVRFQVEVTVDGDELIVDWSGTDKQARGPINATYGVTAGATYNAVFPPDRRRYSQERWRLPADSNHRSARVGCERAVSGPFGCRQHGDAPEAR